MSSTRPDAPQTTSVSEHSRLVALAIGLPLGMFGGHRFYLGKRGGIAMLLTLGGLGLWYLYDMIVLTAGEMKDGRGRRVVKWTADDTTPYSVDHVKREQFEQLMDELDHLRGEVMDLNERLDFHERRLRRGPD